MLLRLRNAFIAVHHIFVLCRVRSRVSRLLGSAGAGECTQQANEQSCSHCSRSVLSRRGGAQPLTIAAQRCGGPTGAVGTNPWPCIVAAEDGAAALLFP